MYNLHNSLRREALARVEDSARTLADFENVIKTWDKIEENKQTYRESKEFLFSQLSATQSGSELAEEAKLDVQTFTSECVFPPPIRHRLWRQQMFGNFHDTIFDCPYEIGELVADRAISQALEALNDNQKQVLYFRAIREWSFQRIADFRGQTDRNVRQVYDMAIAKLKRKLAKQEPQCGGLRPTAGGLTEVKT